FFAGSPSRGTTPPARRRTSRSSASSRTTAVPPRASIATGHVAFEAFLAGPNVAAFEEGILIERGGALTLVMRHGDQARGLGPCARCPVCDEPATPARCGRWRWTVRVPLAPLRRLHGGLVQETDAGLALIHLAGTQAPGLAPGITLGSQFPFLDDAEHLFFESFLSGSGVTTANNESIWSDCSGVLSLVVREGQPAPGTDAVFGAGSSRSPPSACAPSNSTRSRASCSTATSRAPGSTTSTTRGCGS